MFHIPRYAVGQNKGISRYLTQINGGKVEQLCLTKAMLLTTLFYIIGLKISAAR